MTRVSAPAPPTPETLPVSFGADPEYLIRGLASDISAVECIFDLIDNSIDAARNEILSQTAAMKDEHGLPASYEGFHVDLWLSDDQIIVDDDCAGISAEDLSHRTFRIGVKSKHPFGIGHFGVGLKRAVFKLGTAVSLQTDDGANAVSFSFDEAAVLQAGDQPLPAALHPSTGRKGNVLKVSSLRPDVRADVRSPDWIDRLKDGLRRRYGIFVRKGLVLRVDGAMVAPFGPDVRSINVGPMRRISRFMTTEGGVQIFATAGLHEAYRIKGLEADYDETRHRAISSEFGWYLVCNDRIILVADRSERSGWTTGWHNEYAGFLGWVHYVSENPELLPWDSKKSGINPSSEAHRESVGWLKGIADDFRAQKNKLRDRSSRGSGRNERASGEGSRRSPDPVNRRVGKEVTPTQPPVATTTTPVHTERLATLFYPCAMATTSPKVRSLVDEACRLQISDFPYAAAFHLRALFEVVLVDFLKRHRRFSDVKEYVFAEQASAGRPFDDRQKRNFSPTLDNILDWVLRNDEVFPDAERRTCKRGCENFKAQVRRINGIVHEDGVLTGSSQVTEFRNEILPALRALLAN